MRQRGRVAAKYSSTEFACTPTGDARRRRRYHDNDRIRQENHMLILDNATLIDLEHGELQHNCFVTIEGESIVEVGVGRPQSSAERLDLSGRCLLPGLIDAHFHATLTEMNPALLRDLPPTLMTARAAQYLRGALKRGFTTVRDMGGADWGLRAAVEEGTLIGPRLFIAGRALSQTGGHGDLRRRTDSESVCSCSGALKFMSVVADGKSGVQLAAREQLRQGVNHLKVFVSGGVVSPTDPLASAQYTDEELAAVVHEAKSWNTYVAAHAYTPAAIIRAVNAGVRTIEHGNLLNAEAAQLLATRGSYLVPTLVTYEAMRRTAPKIQLSAFSIEKLETVLNAGLRSIEVAQAAGVKLGFGTDLLGDLHEHQSEEFSIRCRVQEPRAVLASATTINAQILGQDSLLGTIAPGAWADLIAIDGNPLEDMGLLEGQGRHLDLIMTRGAFFKRTL
jgi:imidazolonepropionase-like amidohydrolase